MKTKKLLAILLVIAMATMLCVSAFAEPAGPNVTGTEESQAAAAITKELKMPVGTNTPAATFSFHFDGTPSIADQSVTFTAADTGSDSGDVKTVYKTTGNFVPSAASFGHAGRYEYTVTETANTYTAADTEKMTYSQAEYKVTIDVANGAKDGDLYIKNVAVQQIKEDDGTASPTNDKVDPSVPGADDTDGNAFKFSNIYVKTAEEDDTDTTDPENPKDPNPENDGTGLYVAKVVSGDMGDKTKAFTFNVKVTAPSLSSKAGYTAEIVDVNESGKVLRTLTFTSGTAKTVELADGQRLIFNDLDIGAAFEVSESAAEGYTAVVSGTGTVAEGVSTGRVAEASDNVTVTNTSNDDSTTPTGILMNNLPYIILLLLVVGGLTGYIVSKRRREQE